MNVARYRIWGLLGCFLLPLQFQGLASPRPCTRQSYALTLLLLLQQLQQQNSAVTLVNLSAFAQNLRRAFAMKQAAPSEVKQLHLARCLGVYILLSLGFFRKKQVRHHAPLSLFNFGSSEPVGNALRGVFFPRALSRNFTMYPFCPCCPLAVSTRGARSAGDALGGFPRKAATARGKRFAHSAGVATARRVRQGQYMSTYFLVIFYLLKSLPVFSSIRGWSGCPLLVFCRLRPIFCFGWGW